MSPWKIGVLSVIVAISVGASWRIQHRAEISSRDRQESLQQQAAQLAELSAENKRLSELITRSKSDSTLSSEQLQQLLKLRNEVAQLRELTKEKPQLQADTAQLKEAESKPKRLLAEAQAAPNYWAKEGLLYSGYADPEAAMKTMLW